MRRYPVTRLCALAGVERQAFYKRDDEALYRRLAIEQFVKQFVLEVRKQDPRIGADKLWRMYRQQFSEEYRVGRDVFRSILHERGLNIKNIKRAPRTTDSRHNLPTYPNLVKSVIPTRPNQIWVSDITYIAIEDPEARLGYIFCFLTIIMDSICLIVSKITLTIMIRLVPPKETSAPNIPLKKIGMMAMITSPTAPIKIT